MDRQPHRPSFGATAETLVLWLAIGSIYFAAAKLGLAFAFGNAQVTAVWPPTGIALVAVMHLGLRALPGVALGAFFANLSVHEPVPVAAAIAVGNTLEATLCYYILHRNHFRLALNDVRSVVTLVCFAAPLAPMASATIGVTALCLGQVVPWSAVFNLWWLWWVGDVLGALVVAPLLLAWLANPSLRMNRITAVELATLLTSVGTISWFVFAQEYHREWAAFQVEYAVFPFLVWAAFRFGLREVFTVAAGVSALAVWGASVGRGPFLGETLDNSLIVLCTFMAITTVTALFMAATVEERTEVRERLSRAQQELEERVHARTAALAAANEQMQEATRLKSQFFATMSHEIRTPLNGIVGMATLLQESPLSIEQYRHLALLRDSADALAELVNDVLDIAKIEAGRMELDRAPFDVRGCVERQAMLLKNMVAEKQIVLSTVVDNRIPNYLLGDSRRFAQIIRNYLSNAIKFTVKGTIVVRAMAQEFTDDACVVRVTVDDTGEGIPAATQHTLFQPYTQAALGRKHGGTGLGLSICKNLATMMQGDVGVQSTVGVGTSFWFTARLERTLGARPDAQLQDVVKTTTVTRGGGTRAKRILVVDDNAVNRVLAVALLNKLGVIAEVAGDGREAIEVLAREHFDLLLLDCQMPEMDGYEVARIVRERQDSGPRLPIIALTASVMPEDRERCYRAGMDDFLAKPLNRNDLTNAIQRWLP